MKKIIFSFFILLTISSPSFADNDNKSDKTYLIAQVDNLEISTKDTLKAIKNKSHVLIDVREVFEYEETHIQGVKLIPLGTLENEIPKLNKKVKYITVCRSGKRSAKAAEILKSKGFNVVSMSGGMLEWNSLNYPAKSGK